MADVCSGSPRSSADVINCQHAKCRSYGSQLPPECQKECESVAALTYDLAAMRPSR